MPTLPARFPVTLALSVAALAVAMVAAAGLGDVRLSPAPVVRGLLAGPSAASLAARIVWEYRLPRIAQAALVGAMLGGSGLAFQALLRNALADPFIIGVSAAASVGSEAVLLLGGSAPAWVVAVGTPGASLAASVAAVALVYGLARRGGQVSVTTLLLAGVVLSSLLGSVAALLLLLGPSQDTQFILGRLSGSLQAATLTQDAALAAALLVGGGVLAALAPSMNLLSLGDVTARQLGVEVDPLKRWLIVAGALLAAATVTVAGAIGFVGFVVPHIARRLAGTPSHPVVLPLTLVTGATLLVLADTAARAALPDGRELPVGAVTALIGAPFYLWVLRRGS